jgi:hypothetical protein
MESVVRIWLGLLALGAGLIHLACVLGSPPALAAVFIAVGAAEFAWGTVAFARERIPVPRLALVGATLPLVGWIVLFLAADAAGSTALTSALRPLPLGIATLLTVSAAIVLAVRRRRARDAAARPAARPVGELSAPRFLVSVGLGALLVAALVTPALAATEAGLNAEPHGSYLDDPGPGHGH